LHRQPEKHPYAHFAFFVRKIIIRIENAISLEKHPQATFLTQ
jgi:hypothetical protein